MSSGSEPAPAASAPVSSSSPIVRQPRVWPALVLAAVYWIAYSVIAALDIPPFSQFLARMAVLAGVMLLFMIWWLTLRGLRMGEKLLVLGWTILSATISTLLAHRTVVAPAILLLALPILITAWSGWMLISRKLSERTRCVGLLILPLLAWLPLWVVRMEGLSGAGESAFRWRWHRSPEEEFLSAVPDHEVRGKSSWKPKAKRLQAMPWDWPEFRGPARDGVAHDIRIATNWNDSPPEAIWRRRVGPGWSSVAIVGHRLFTQEQRGEMEVVSCFDAETGEEVWLHEDATRFEENLGGVGPRATPTFAKGRIYALGANGLLNCLDAIAGDVIWSRNIATESGAKVPMWAFSGSPLVCNGLVIVFAGGNESQQLLAYEAETGTPRWAVAAGKDSYSSPQRVTLDGVEQILFVSDVELLSVDPFSGAELWTFKPEGRAQPCTQPQAVGDGQVLLSFGEGSGTVLLNVTHAGEKWQVEPKWKSRALKPFFNDCVRHENALYGFDANIFCCTDLETGERRWKQGRYGHGQVLLLADQAVLLVLAESGEAVLVAADPQKHFELGKFQAIQGKTWNHPVIARNRLFVRNAEEMACYALAAPLAPEVQSAQR